MRCYIPNPGVTIVSKTQIIRETACFIVIMVCLFNALLDACPYTVAGPREGPQVPLDLLGTSLGFSMEHTE